MDKVNYHHICAFRHVMEKLIFFAGTIRVNFVDGDTKFIRQVS